MPFLHIFDPSGDMPYTAEYCADVLTDFKKRLLNRELKEVEVEVNDTLNFLTYSLLKIIS